MYGKIVIYINIIHKEKMSATLPGMYKVRMYINNVSKKTMITK